VADPTRRANHLRDSCFAGSCRADKQACGGSR
jgi:hypothetical protein